MCMIMNVCPMKGAFFVGVLCTRVGRHTATHLRLWLGCALLCGDRGWSVQSHDVEHAVACCHFVFSYFGMCGLRLSSVSSSEGSLWSDGCSSDEEGEHKVDNATSCMQPTPARGRIFEVCKVVLLCHNLLWT